MKTTTQIYDQKQRLFRKLMERGKRLAKKADPATGGNELLVHNWGNQAAKDAWQGTWKWVRRLDAPYTRLYHEADHRDNHGPGFRPLWCPECVAIEETETPACVACGNHEHAGACHRLEV